MAIVLVYSVGHRLSISLAPSPSPTSAPPPLQPLSHPKHVVYDCCMCVLLQVVCINWDIRICICLHMCRTLAGHTGRVLANGVGGERTDHCHAHQHSGEGEGGCGPICLPLVPVTCWLYCHVCVRALSNPINVSAP